MNLANRALDIPIVDRILFGAGRIEALPGIVREADGNRAFVVTDAGVARAGVADRVRSILGSAGIATQVHAEVEPNPGTVSIALGPRTLARFGTQETVVVAVSRSWTRRSRWVSRPPSPPRRVSTR